MNILITVTLTSICYYDIKTRKIKNTVTLPLLIIGILINGYSYGLRGIADSLLSITLTLLIFIIPFHMNVIGGGDIKLIMALVGISGMRQGIVIVCSIVSIGAMISAIYLLQSRSLRQVIRRCVTYLVNTIIIQRVSPIEIENRGKSFPYSIAILIGYIIATYGF